MDAMTVRMDKAEQRISDRDHKSMENNEVEKKDGNKAKLHNTILRQISNLLKRNNIHIIGVPEDKEREKGEENLFK